ncbi:MIS12/MIND complex Mis12 [Schizosaccharomyces osmophilus]|uniref:MIS12/MIND complex Mis12 n=1 Tax=Schizosaccharomyces osmophilus TaxID=2545709 RepID=A0AAE9WAH9_9SCHI|nr:MIS12/MIND complex Mis12 [Schizosaccharomyces osmophilus]WBW71682.1 MIS12/MIND complex Mis12 [Schizosaccharomyces osmophilus]
MLVQLFEFTPLSFIDDVINITNQLLYKTVNGVDRAFSSLSSTKKSPQEIEEGLHKFEILFESIVDRYYDRFEIYVLRNIFHYPPELKGYLRLEGQTADYTITVEKDAALDQEIEDATQALTEKLKARHSLRVRLRKSEERRQQLKQQLGTLSFLSSIPKEQRITLPETTDFLLDQLAGLQISLHSVTQASPIVPSREVDERVMYLEKRYEKLAGPVEQHRDFWSHQLIKLESIANTQDVSNMSKLLSSSDDSNSA